jgi:SAM-dependent methyltransferase
MERICEPELMDDVQQAREYSEADFSASDASTVGRIFSRFPDGQLGARILDLGCGPGNITFPLAARSPGATVLGLDGAAEMLAIADRRRHALPGGAAGEAASRLAFHRAVLPLPATGLAELGGAFTALVSNSLLHHLHDPLVLWRSLRQLGAPGAAVYVCDLRRPDSEAALAQLLSLHAAMAPPLVRRDFALSLRAAFRPQEISDQLRALGLEALRVESRDDRYLEVHGRLP